MQPFTAAITNLDERYIAPVIH